MIKELTGKKCFLEFKIQRSLNVKPQDVKEKNPKQTQKMLKASRQKSQVMCKYKWELYWQWTTKQQYCIPQVNWAISSNFGGKVIVKLAFHSIPSQSNISVGGTDTLSDKKGFKQLLKQLFSNVLLQKIFKLL